jgi:hypothetical protein
MLSYNRGMAAHILTVEAVFDITGRGLVVVPGPLEKDYVGPPELAVRLILPDGDEKLASMRLKHVFQSPPAKESRFACILTGVAKADVPIGTEVSRSGPDSRSEHHARSGRKDRRRSGIREGIGAPPYSRPRGHLAGPIRLEGGSR